MLHELRGEARGEQMLGERAVRRVAALAVAPQQAGEVFFHHAAHRRQFVHHGVVDDLLHARADRFGDGDADGRGVRRRRTAAGRVNFCAARRAATCAASRAQSCVSVAGTATRRLARRVGRLQTAPSPWRSRRTASLRRACAVFALLGCCSAAMRRAWSISQGFDSAIVRDAGPSGLESARESAGADRRAGRLSADRRECLRSDARRLHARSAGQRESVRARRRRGLRGHGWGAPAMRSCASGLPGRRLGCIHRGTHGRARNNLRSGLCIVTGG